MKKIERQIEMRRQRMCQLKAAVERLSISFESSQGEKRRQTLTIPTTCSQRQSESEPKAARDVSTGLKQQSVTEQLVAQSKQLRDLLQQSRAQSQKSRSKSKVMRSKSKVMRSKSNVTDGNASTDMKYLYFFANASLTLHVVEYLQRMPQLHLEFMSVIHQIDGWVVSIKINSTLNVQQSGDFRAFLNELGFPYKAPVRVNMALLSLEAGESPINVMQRYQVVVVSHGSPNKSEIEAFRHQFAEGLGYCPETLA